MLVVSDATPLNVLIRADLIDLLAELFGIILIPPAVLHELSHASTPLRVREWFRTPPPWVKIQAPSHPLTYGPKGPGEREAIALARELKADLLLADDKAARTTAVSLGIPTIGTLGILEQAASQDLIPLGPSIERIRSEGLFLTDTLIEDALHRDAQRRFTANAPDQHDSQEPGSNPAS